MTQTQTIADKVRDVDLQVNIDEAARRLIGLHEDLARAEQRLAEIDKQLKQVDSALAQQMANAGCFNLLVVREFRHYAINRLPLSCHTDDACLEISPLSTSAAIAQRLQAKTPSAPNAEG